MAIEYEKVNGELLLCYSPESAESIDYVKNRLASNEDLRIKNTFCVNVRLLRNLENADDWEVTFRFCIGKIGKEYIEIDNEVIYTEHHFFIANDIKIKTDLFVAYRNISILSKIDQVIENDFYLGGKWEEKVNGIPEETYRDLIKNFPKTSEVDKYCHFRIANILQDYFPETGRYMEVYNKFINRKNNMSSNAVAGDQTNINHEIKLMQFSNALDEIQEMLRQPDVIGEKEWQKRIHDILLLIYPKYILCTREIKFSGVDGYDKQPDFIMVDMNGFVDILEIKRANVRILSKQASYRNNYVPTRELAGAIQQIEKYIYCLSSIEKSQKTTINKLSTLLPQEIHPRIVNPQGLLLLGRSNEFSERQKQDFELIKRQYKNIADIMTYDELVARLHNIVIMLKQENK